MIVGKVRNGKLSFEQDNEDKHKCSFCSNDAVMFASSRGLYFCGECLGN